MPRINHDKPTKSIVLSIPNKLYYKIKDENDKENRKGTAPKTLLSDKLINIIKSYYDESPTNKTL